MRSLVIILSLLVVPFTNAAGTIQTNGIFGGLLLGGTTNIISDNGTTLTRNGSAISGGGGIVGTVSNSVAQSGLLAVDATKTNGIAATAAHITNAFGIFNGNTNEFVNGAGLLSTIYNVVTNNTMTGTNGITVRGTTNGTNVTIEIGQTNFVLKTGDTMTGALATPQLQITNVNASSFAYFDSGKNLTNAPYVPMNKVGDVMTGTLVTPELDASQLLVGAMAVNRGTLTHAGGNVIVDFAQTNRYWSCTLTGNVTFVLTNASAGKWANLLLYQSQATNVTPTFNLPAGITNWFGGAPSTLTAGTVGALSYYCIDSSTNSTKAAYAETQ